MLQHYKKTFVGMQIFIWVMAALFTLATRSLHAGTAAFGTMQVGALLGAAWAGRLKNLSPRASPRA
jgi:hypothetical protein